MSQVHGADDPILVADIGGTNARFALASSGPDGCAIDRLEIYRAEDFETIRDAMDAYREGQGCPEIRSACFAVAAPILGDIARFTNSHWQIDAKALCQDFGLSRFRMINDFVALSYGTTGLARDDIVTVKPGTAVAGEPIAVIGPGTGLGQATLLPESDGARVVAGQGGHAMFAPMDDLEIEVLRFIRREHNAVTYERLLSGRGLVNIHRALCVIADLPRVALRPADITEAALTGEYPVAKQAVDMFCAVLGTFAGGAALMVNATGGVRLGGGILPRIPEVLLNSSFTQRFLAADQMRDLLSDIPVDLIVRGDVALLGAAQWHIDHAQGEKHVSHQ